MGLADTLKMNIVDRGRRYERKEIEENETKGGKFSHLTIIRSFSFDVFNTQFRVIAVSHCFIIYCYHSAYII
jgi:hypothetical protein